MESFASHQHPLGQRDKAEEPREVKPASGSWCFVSVMFFMCGRQQCLVAIPWLPCLTVSQTHILNMGCPWRSFSA